MRILIIFLSLIWLVHSITVTTATATVTIDKSIITHNSHNVRLYRRGKKQKENSTTTIITLPTATMANTTTNYNGTLVGNNNTTEDVNAVFIPVVVMAFISFFSSLAVIIIPLLLSRRLLLTSANQETTGFSCTATTTLVAVVDLVLTSMSVINGLWVLSQSTLPPDRTVCSALGGLFSLMVLVEWMLAIAVAFYIHSILTRRYDHSNSFNNRSKLSISIVMGGFVVCAIASVVWVAVEGGFGPTGGYWCQTDPNSLTGAKFMLAMTLFGLVSLLAIIWMHSRSIHYLKRHFNTEISNNAVDAVETKSSNTTQQQEGENELRKWQEMNSNAVDWSHEWTLHNKQPELTQSYRTAFFSAAESLSSIEDNYDKILIRDDPVILQSSSSSLDIKAASDDGDSDGETAIISLPSCSPIEYSSRGKSRDKEEKGMAIISNSHGQMAILKLALYMAAFGVQWIPLLILYTYLLLSQSYPVALFAICGICLNSRGLLNAIITFSFRNKNTNNK